jgi:hypothetical protein
MKPIMLNGNSISLQDLIVKHLPDESSERGSWFDLNGNRVWLLWTEVERAEQEVSEQEYNDLLFTDSSMMRINKSSVEVKRNKEVCLIKISTVGSVSRFIRYDANQTDFELLTRYISP